MSCDLGATETRQVWQPHSASACAVTSPSTKSALDTRGILLTCVADHVPVHLDKSARPHLDKDYPNNIPSPRPQGRSPRPQVKIEQPSLTGDLVGWRGGGERIRATEAESQWIVAARPLCHLQYLVAYLSRLQRILPAARWELRFKASRNANLPCEGRQRHVPLGGWAPYCWSANGRRAHASLLARILT